MSTPPCANACAERDRLGVDARQQVVGEDDLFLGAGLRLLARRLLVEHRRGQGRSVAATGTTALEFGHGCSCCLRPGIRRMLDRTRILTRVSGAERGRLADRVRLACADHGVRRAGRTEVVSPHPELADYLVAHGTPPDSVQEALIDETAKLGGVAGMQIAPEQGTFLTILTRLLDVHAAIEIGTFTGYSALCIARGLWPTAAGSRAATSPRSGRRSLARTGRRPASRIASTSRSRPRSTRSTRSRRTRRSTSRSSTPTSPTTPTTTRPCSRRMRPNGAILVDNVLWSGRVVAPDADDANLEAIRAFNDMVAADDRVDTVMLPISTALRCCASARATCPAASCSTAPSSRGWSRGVARSRRAGVRPR